MIKIGIEIGIDTGDIRHILLMKDIKPSVSGYFKMQTVFVLKKIYGVLAQLGERLFCKQKVAGSKPVRSTRPLV